jgi:hypothetical protein
VTDGTTKTETPATRGFGVLLLVIVAVIFAANGLTLWLLGRYFPILLAITGPLITLGVVTLIYPPVWDSVFSDLPPKSRYLKPIAIAAVLSGIVLGIIILLKLNYG